MKRFIVTIEDIASWSAVSAAVHRAARGKRQRAEVVRFFDDIEGSLSQVIASLRSGRLPVGTFHRFIIHDPKRREITAAPFLDRVAHHAMVEPVLKPLESWLAHTSFACRQGKGVHAAAEYAQRQCRRFPVYLKMDVRGYFENINHRLLKQLLHKRVRGDEFFALTDAVLHSYQTTPGNGLPIGALTSQQFANVYLNPADQWLQAQPQVRAHCRYMDDILIWCDSTDAARKLYADFKQYLAQQWLLTLKPAIIQRCRYGLSFCGYRIFPSVIKPGHRRLRRCKQRLQFWQNEYRRGAIDMLQLQRNTDAVFAVTQPAQCLHWRRRLMAGGLDGADL